jgi:hypothetical protein
MGRIGCPKKKGKKATNQRHVKPQDREDVNYTTAKARNIAKP